MRFFVSHDLRKNRPLKAIIIWMLIFLIPFWVTNGLFYIRLGFSPSAITKYYRGDPDHFRQPRPFFSFVEETHFHTFAMAILLMTLLHLLLFTTLHTKIKLVLVHTTFASAFFDILSNWAIRYIHPVFSYVKLISASLFEGVLGVLIIVLCWSITSRPFSFGGFNRTTNMTRNQPLKDGAR